MTMHPTKPHFLTVNTNDRQAFTIGDISVSYTSRYRCLGTPILNATAGQQLQLHLESKSNHVVKYLSFLAKNEDAPFTVKKIVCDSALKSAIFYSAKTLCF